MIAKTDLLLKKKDAFTLAGVFISKCFFSPFLYSCLCVLYNFQHWCVWVCVCSAGWQPYWHFLRWFLWAYSIRITEGFHLVSSSLHAKRRVPGASVYEPSRICCCRTQPGWSSATRQQRPLLVAPTTTSSLPCHQTPHHPHPQPHTLHLTRWSFRLSFRCSSLVYFSPESVFKTFPTAGFLCKCCCTK